MPPPAHIRLKQEVFRPAVRELGGDILEVGFGKRPELEDYRSARKVTFVDKRVQRLPERSFSFNRRIEIEIWRCDLERLPFPESTFDGVVGTFVFCSVEDVRRAILELRRVCKPDAICVFLEHVLSEARIVRVAQHLLTPVHSALRGGCRLNRDPIREFETAGWQIQQRERTKHVLPWLCFVGSNRK